MKDILEKNYDDRGKNVTTCTSNTVVKLNQEKICSRCESDTSKSINYCNVCGNNLHSLSMNDKFNIKDINIKASDINTNIDKLNPKGININYIIKALGIDLLVGIGIGCLLYFLTTSILTSDMSYYTIEFFNYILPNGFFMLAGISVFKFVSFIPIDVMYDKIYIYDTINMLKLHSLFAILAIILGIYSGIMIYIKFIIGKNMVNKNVDNELLNIGTFSALYGLIMGLLSKGMFLQAFITTFIISFVPMIAGYKYKSKKYK